MSISLKKVLSIVVCLLCVALSAIAGPIHVSASMNYSSTYKGNGRANYGYSARPMHTSMSSAGLVQAPSISMGSTTSSFNRGIACGNEMMTSAPQARGIYTSASNVTGGVTAEETYSPAQAPSKRRNSVEGGPGVPEGTCTECHWVWHPELGYYVCDICGSNSLDGCDHEYEEGYCWCPLDFNGAVALFMALLACAYAFNKVRVKKSNEE